MDAVDAVNGAAVLRALEARKALLAGAVAALAAPDSRAAELVRNLCAARKLRTFCTCFLSAVRKCSKILF